MVNWTVLMKEEIPCPQCGKSTEVKIKTLWYKYKIEVKKK